MRSYRGFVTSSGELRWSYEGPAALRDDEYDVLLVRISLAGWNPLKRDPLELSKKLVDCGVVRWLTPGEDEWSVDGDRLRKELAAFSPPRWLRGHFHVRPEVIVEESEAQEVGEDDEEDSIEMWRETFLALYLNRGRESDSGT